MPTYNAFLTIREKFLELWGIDFLSAFVGLSQSFSMKPKFSKIW
jgi:hypothetical protein